MTLLTDHFQVNDISEVSDELLVNNYEASCKVFYNPQDFPDADIYYLEKVNEEMFTELALRLHPAAFIR